eukprot:m.90677 g.90677  ORF g.90677 m.90677 type:complete len:476 (-) comp12920_c0_seq1:255-1682(-)
MKQADLQALCVALLRSSCKDMQDLTPTEQLLCSMGAETVDAFTLSWRSYVCELLYMKMAYLLTNGHFKAEFQADLDTMFAAEMRQFLEARDQPDPTQGGSPGMAQPFPCILQVSFTWLKKTTKLSSWLDCLFFLVICWLTPALSANTQKAEASALFTALSRRLFEWRDSIESFCQQELQSLYLEPCSPASKAVFEYLVPCFQGNLSFAEMWGIVTRQQSVSNMDKYVLLNCGMAPNDEASVTSWLTFISASPEATQNTLGRHLEDTLKWISEHELPVPGFFSELFCKSASNLMSHNPVMQSKQIVIHFTHLLPHMSPEARATAAQLIHLARMKLLSAKDIMHGVLEAFIQHERSIMSHAPDCVTITDFIRLRAWPCHVTGETTFSQSKPLNREIFTELAAMLERFDPCSRLNIVKQVLLQQKIDALDPIPNALQQQMEQTECALNNTLAFLKQVHLSYLLCTEQETISPLPQLDL